MKLDEMKECIVKELYTYKSYDLPGRCKLIGLADGTEQEAFKSKSMYVKKRIGPLNKEEVIRVLEKMKEELDIVLIPEDKYSYKISEITKRNITEILKNGVSADYAFEDRLDKIEWHGTKSELNFIERILKKVSDNVAKEQYNNFKIEYSNCKCIYDANYCFLELETSPYQSGDDKLFFEILCEIFHPEVRNEQHNWEMVKEAISKALKEDGFTFYKKEKISGKDVFGVREIHFLDETSVHTEGIVKLGKIINTPYIMQQIKILKDNVKNNSTVAIGKSKELLEATFKFILSELNIEYSNKDELNDLNKKVINVLGLNLTEENKKIKGITNLFGGLINISQGLATLRNEFGDGHGKDPDYVALSRIYGELAVGSASVYIAFLLNIYEQKKKK